MTELPLQNIREAARRIEGRVRTTPLLQVAPTRGLPFAGDLWLKLESLQVTGSFKARGASNKLLSLNAAELRKGLVTASGGNHGLGVAYAAWQAGVPARIFLPTSTPASKAEKLRAWDAEVVHHGAVWDEANAEAQADAARSGMTYVHPFADPAVVAGQGTIGLEIIAQLPAPDLVLVAIGGGGLISGVAAALKQLRPQTRVIGVEPIGAATLKRSLEAGALITLERIETKAGTLAPRRSDAFNLALVQRHVDEIVLVSDADMQAAARWLWFECGVAAELSGAASIAALSSGAVRPAAESTVVALVCGAGTDGLPAGASN